MPTRTRQAAGTSFAQTQRRADGQTYWLPTVLSDGLNAAASTRASITCTSGAANTKGTPVEIVAATTHDITLLDIYPTAGFTGGGAGMLLDIVIGASLNVVIVPNLNFGYNNVGTRWRIPVHIPLGTRVGVQNATVSGAQAQTCVFTFKTFPLAKQPSPTVVTYGADTANSRGTVLNVPGSANADSTWKEITAATTEPVGALLFGLGGGADTVMATGTALFDIGSGTAGAETVIVPSIHAISSTNESWVLTDNGPFFVNVPTGTRLACRYRSTTTANTPDVTLHGIRY